MPSPSIWNALPLRLNSSGHAVQILQQLLNSRVQPPPGLVPDGRFGQRTDTAVRSFQRQYSLKVDGIVGPRTLSLLLGNEHKHMLAPSNGVLASGILAGATPKVAIRADAPWMAIAQLELGVVEIPGAEHTQRIIDYHATTTLKATSDEVPWCSSFVNWCLAQAKIAGTNSAAAISWLDWRNATTLTEPRYGCITVLRYSKPGHDAATGSSSGNHVGFWITGSGDHKTLLGGNQGNRVRESTFGVNYKVLGHKWPAMVR